MFNVGLLHTWPWY